MDKVRSDKTAFAVVFALCMAAGIIAALCKCGMHEDEFYSYYSSNRTYGFIAEGTVSREVMLDELKVLPGAGFDFSLVREVQSWDVHPPVYYFVLHFVCSLIPGVFSVWQGLGINLVCLAVSIILMKKLGEMLIPDNQILTDTAILAWGLSPALLSGVAFIRMYMLLTVWVLAVTILHVSYIKRKFDVSVKKINDGSGFSENTSPVKSEAVFFVLLWIFTFLGFLTHYYFFIWLFFLAGAFNIFLIIRKKSIKTLIIYALTEISCAAACYLAYPAFPAQMFKGQRGAQATGNFFDLSNTTERLSFFASVLNRLGFGGVLWIVLGIMVILALLKSDRIHLMKRAKSPLPERTDAWNKEDAGEDDEDETDSTDEETEANAKTLKAVAFILAAAMIGYFLTVSKTALLLGDSSIRYVMPVLGAAYILIAYILNRVIMVDDRMFSRPGRYFVWLVMLVILGLNVSMLFKGGVQFLYRENKENLSELAAHSGADVYYIYPEGQSWIMWAEGTQLLTFDEVTYISSEETWSGADGYGDLKDKLLKKHAESGTNEAILYIDVGEDTDHVLKFFADAFGSEPEADLLFEDGYAQTMLLKIP